MLAINAASFALFKDFCERERCPFSVLGEATDDGHLEVFDPFFGNKPVDIGLSVMLGKPPKMLREINRLPAKVKDKDVPRIDLNEAVIRVLSFPAVGDKTFLISIGDRSVGGLCSRDQFVGPWQTPVSDVAVTTMGFNQYLGEAFTIGERTPLAVLNGPASGRMAIGEAITNIAGSAIDNIESIKLSANWMASAGFEGEDAILYDTVKAVGMDLCPKLGISIPVGKDSMSMRTAWTDETVPKEVVAPVSLIVSAFAPVSDVRKTATPELKADLDTQLLLIDLGGAKNRLGGSVLYQAFNYEQGVCPDVDDADRLKRFFKVVQELNRKNYLMAYHDRSDGGLLVTACEMMFASHVGVTLNIDSSAHSKGIIPELFSEELGAIIQVSNRHIEKVNKLFEANGLGAYARRIGHLNEVGKLEILENGSLVFQDNGPNLRRIWSRVTFQMQSLRDNPVCARSEYDQILRTDDPGLSAKLTYDINDPTRTFKVSKKIKPKIAILREQGVNGHIEMAAAFDRAGFDAVDVHMSDILSGRTTLAEFKGLAACGGFSYGDVLGAGEGWAKSILFNTLAFDEFSSFFERNDSFALGVCNGCQMMSNLREIIPGADHWPRFVKNQSEQFEARFVTVEVTPSPSILFANMIGSRIPVVTAHGEGYAEFESSRHEESADKYIALRYVDNYGDATETYPSNPNGSRGGITSLTSQDGRFTIMMPHPERVFRTVQNSWHPQEWDEDGAWMYMFRNARFWLG